MIPEYFEVGEEARRVCIILRSSSVIWTLPLSRGWRMLPEYLEVSVEAGGGCTSHTSYGLTL
jgi:hypothetical protein